MSIAAMNWAMRQATGSPSAQCVLYVIADVANPEGIGWPSVRYIAEHSQQSMDTARKRLKDLEDAGYLVRFERHEASGRRTSDEIRLQMGDQAVPIDPDPTPDDSGGPDASTPKNGDAKAGGGPSQSARGDPRNLQGGPSRGAGGGPSQLCEGHSIEPSKEPPSPNPSHGPPDGGGPGAGQGSGESESLAAFKAAYPIPTTHPAEVARLFSARTAAEQERLTLGARGYAAFLKNRKKREPMDMRKFLRDPAIAEEFVPYAPKLEPDRAFFANGSPTFCAWRVLLKLFTFTIDSIHMGEGPDGKAGAYLPPLPAGALALARLVDVDGQIDQRDWIFVEHKSPEWWAWNERAQKWGGSLPEADMVDTGETYRQTLPGGRSEIMPVRKSGLLFPSQWPPALGAASKAKGDQDGAEKNAH